MTPAHERENIELLPSSIKQFYATDILNVLLKSSAFCRCLRVVPFGISYSEMSLGSSNNRATRDAATVACVSSKHATGTYTIFVVI